MIRKFFLPSLLALLLSTGAWAQNDAQSYITMLPTLLQTVQMKAQMTQQSYAWARQMGDQQEMQRCQAEQRLHETMYNGAHGLLQNPRQLNDPKVQRQLICALHEYNYRTECRDLRPYQQIQGPLAQYVAHVQWKAGTPQGQAAHQTSLNGIQANTAQMTANHNMRMNNLQAQSAAHNQAWSNNQARGDISHQQYVHGIYNEYLYVQPNTNQGYWVPMEYQNPAVINANGSCTELVPYQNY
jgi:hypothetical protein